MRYSSGFPCYETEKTLGENYSIRGINSKNSPKYKDTFR